MNLVYYDHSFFGHFVTFSLLGILISVVGIINFDDNLSAHAQANPSYSTNQSKQNNSTQHAPGLAKDPIYTESTKSTSTRILNIDPIPIVEVTYKGNSTINGHPTQTLGTLIDSMDKNGAVHSQGKAIILVSTGQIITYKLESIGYYNSDGSFSDNGVMMFNLPFHQINENSTGMKSSINSTSHIDFKNLFGIYKKTVDPAGNGLTKVWKWN